SNSGLYGAFNYVRDLLTYNNNLYIATDGGVFLSSNYGESWIAINQGLEGTLIKSLAVYQNKLFASGWYNGDVFISLDNGLNWKPIKIGMPNDAEIYSIDAFDNRLFASSLNHGLYCIDIPEIIVDVNDENSQNLNFSLEQNYPNPFNSSTNINFTINNEGLVTLKIYNCLGEEIDCLINDILKPGKYSKQFYTNNLCSGIYFYKLNYQDKIISKKMCLIK
ncbi:MAG TPA: T9SS type A sorting domain-containing protein, partial [Melioribacteraceae bacterium]|nr:T9SS type A sorting domain-containing protein [Melioribacteraceae bacterium]